MRWLAQAFALVAIWSSGCAVGTPAGGRRTLAEARYRFFSPPVLPKLVVKPPKPPPPGAPGAPKPPPIDRAKIVKLAQGLVGKTRIEVGGKKYPDDCTGFLQAVFKQVGVDVLAAGLPGDNGVTAIYRFTQTQGRTYDGGRPLPGDLIFFRDTYDQNQDGRPNDGLTHIALVEASLPDGTVSLIHRINRGVVRYRMNLRWPDMPLHPWTGDPINNFLRAGRGKGGAVTTGELFASYATLNRLK